MTRKSRNRPINPVPDGVPVPDSTQSNKQRRRQLATVILLLVAIGCASVYLLAGMVKPSLSHSPSGPPTPLTPAPSGELATYVGSAVCMT